MLCRERLSLHGTDQHIDRDHPPNLPHIWSRRHNDVPRVLQSNVDAVIAQVSSVTNILCCSAVPTAFCCVVSKHWKCCRLFTFSPRVVALLQVNAYAAAHGIKYGMISNLLWSWALVMDGRNHMQISQPLRYDASNPTVLQVSLYKPIQHDGSWHPILQLCLVPCYKPKCVLCAGSCMGYCHVFEK